MCRILYLLTAACRNMSLTVSGGAFTSICGGGKSFSKLSFTWAIQEANAFLDLKSLSVNPREFVLPPYSLAVGSLYRVTLTATHLLSFKSSSASTQVFVQSGRIVCILSSGSRLNMRIDGFALLDWAGSYDENIPNTYGSNAGLVFSYACFQSYPIYLESCSLLFSPSDTDGIFIRAGLNFTKPAAIGDIYTLTVTSTAQDSRDLRSSSAVVEISVIGSSSPVVSLIAPFGTRINPSSKLKLLASVDMKSQGEATWLVDDPTLSLSNIALSSVATTLIASRPGTPHILSLVINGDSLREQSSYTFQLRIAYANNMTITNSILIQTNSPPVPGQFQIFPIVGVPLETSFSLLASKWVDSDLPMSYQFGFYTSLSQGVVMRSRMELAYTSGLLPAGNGENSSLSCFVQVFDVMDASGLLRTDVILKEKSFTIDDLTNFLQGEVNKSSDNLDSLKNVLATTTSALVRSNCSQAPNCKELNRMDCGFVDGTCGECLNNYVGEAGDSNTLCISLDDFPSRSRRQLSSITCSSNSDCAHDLFLYCSSDGVCREIQQSCPNNCTNRGICHYVSVIERNTTVSECGVSDLHCKAVCECEVDFVGASCSMTVADFEKASLLRQSIVENIRNMMALENPDRNSIRSWVDNLYALALDYSSLNSNTKILLGSLAESIFRLAKTTGMAVEDLHNLNVVVNAVLSDPAFRNPSLFKLYSEFVASDMIQGQNNVEVVTSLFRSSTTLLSAASSVAITIPSTALETLSQNQNQGVVLLNQVSNSASITLFEVHAPSIDSLAPLQLSTSLGAIFDKNPCGDNSICSMIFTLRNKYKGSQLALEARPIGTYEIDNGLLNVTASGTYYQVKCDSGRPGYFTHACPSGNNLTIICDGNFVGRAEAQCPLYRPVTTCALRVDQLPRGFDLTCVTLELDEETTKCQCNFSTSHRRLDIDDDYSSDETVQFSLQSMQMSVVEEFVTTWKDAGSLSTSDIRESWTVLLTVGLIGVLFTLLVVLGYHADQKGKESHEAQVSTTKANETLRTRVPKSKGQVATSRYMRNKSGRKVSQGTLLVREEFDKIEESLPAVFRADSVWNKFIREVKVYHRWLGIIFYYSPQFPRSMRVLSLFSSIITMLFIQSLTYNIADPDDKSCEDCESESCCQDKVSSLNSNSPMCSWRKYNSTSSAEDGSCHFIPIEGDMSRMFMVAIISAVISAPLTLCVQYIISNILSREIRQKEDELRSTFQISRNRRTTVGGNMSSDLAEVTGNNLQEDFSNLLKELREHYRTLRGNEKEEFAGM